MHLYYTAAYHHLIAAGGEKSPHRWHDRRVALLSHKRSGTLLDLGCSSGAFLESMKGASWKLYGIEMDPENAHTAKTRSGAEIFVGDIPDAPFPHGSIDVITCFDVLEHVFDPIVVLQRVAEWLKPGGLLYVLVPNIDSAEARVFKSYWHGLELPRHLFHFSPGSLRSLAASMKLIEVSLKTRRNSAVGTSLRYVWDDVFGSMGIRRTPVAYRGEAGLAWRSARKVVRLTALRALLAMAPLCGGGESIHAIFRKEGVGNDG
jgi:2-polyprenyl-3-methyl-5-hydroxy-6-metoxy-1,4-benzoquinol methylase